MMKPTTEKWYVSSLWKKILVARRLKSWKELLDPMKYFPLSHRTSPALVLVDRQVACCWAASSRGTCGYRPHNQFFNHRLLTRGVSNVGDVMTSSQQNSHGGGPNGGWRRCATSSPTAHNPQPLATMVDENEDLAHRQPVSGRRWLENIEISG